MFRHALRFAWLGALACGFVPPAALADALSLDSCLTLALARHPEMRASGAELRAADARVRRASALDPPSISASAGKLGSALGNAERDESWRVSQDLPLFGQRAGAVRVARREHEWANAGRASLALHLRGELTRAYRRLQADSLALHTVRELDATARDLERMVAIRLGTGGARYLDVLRARSERARIENDALDAELALREDQRTLNVLMAREPDAPLAAADPFVRTPLPGPLDSLLAHARRTRPALDAARIAVARGEARIAEERRARWPVASVSAGLDRVAGARGPGFGGEIGLTLPFAPWSDARARVGEAVAERDAAAARGEAAERGLEAALRSAYDGARTAETRLRRFEDLLLADAHDAIRAAVQNYQAGQIEGLELFETLRTLRTIQLEHVRARLDYELALADLDVAEQP